MKTKYLVCSKDIVKRINNIHFFINARAKATYFTRKSKLNFTDLVYFIINMGKKNLDLEIASYLENVKMVNMDYTKQAFSKARQKILPSAFKELNNDIIKNVYTGNEYKTYKGYRLLAIDSSTSELPNNEELRKAYGYCTAKKVDIAMGRISGLYDVENEIIIDAVIDRYDCNEQILATNHINSLIKHGLRKDLILFDRGYPSSNLITLLAKNNIDYLMRVQKNFIRKLVETKQDDEIVNLRLKGKELQIRVVKVILESGVEEILITSILDNSMTSEELKYLYFQRWKFETKYNELKNRLEIECYSGETKIAIEQDFNITIFLSNMASLAKAAANDEVAKEHTAKELKYDYKVNMNTLIGKIKLNLVKMMLEEDATKRVAIFEGVIDKVTKSLVPIRPGRSNPRRAYKGTRKYHRNDKRCM